MEKHWNLNNLYTAFDSEKLKSDIGRLENLIKEALEYTKTAFSSPEDGAAKLRKAIDMTNTITDLIDLIANYANLTYSVDTKHYDALKLIEKVESYSSDLTQIEVSLRKFIASIEDVGTLLRDNNDLQTYRYFIESEKEASQYLLSDSEEVLLAELKNTGSNAWSKLQDHLIGTLMVDYDNEQLPITIIRNYAYAHDSEKRRKAYEAELKAYEKIDQITASCLNAIKGEVITEVGKRGYKSALDMTLVSSRMDQETLDAMFTAINEYLPIFHEYLKKKSSLLGHQDGLPFYDLFAPMGETEMNYSLEQAAEFIIKNFSTFSEALGNFAKKAFDECWIDSEPRKGKISGAFCANIHGIKESRVMSNFSGSFSDVVTLAHELGHAYHGECLKDEPALNSDYPMPLAETASILAETIVYNAALKTASPDDARTILENSIMSSTQVVVDIFSRYLFETELFEKRKDSSLTVDELKDSMLRAQKKAYGDGLDHQLLHPYMWVCKPHYYSAGYNFYNFPYAFGLLFAKGLYAKYLEEGDAFVKKYDDLLQATGSNNIKDVLAIAGVDAHDPEFFRSSLKVISEEIKKFIAM